MIGYEDFEGLNGPQPTGEYRGSMYDVFPLSGEKVKMKDGSLKGSLRVFGNADRLLDVCSRLEKKYGTILVKHSNGFLDRYEDGRLVTAGDVE